MFHHMMTWFKGSKETPQPKPKGSLIDRDLEESITKAKISRQRIEELLVTRQSGNVLADTWGNREQ